MPEPPPIARQAPLVVTLGFDEETFERLDALRRRFFPPERNVVPAHLSLFHALPAADREAVAAELRAAADDSPPMPVRFASILPLGSGFALKAEATGLAPLHRRLAAAFGPWLTPQDRQPLRPHVTLMNKADRLAARLALATFRDEFEPWTGRADSLRLWAYLGGPWQPLARYHCSGDTPSPSEA